MIEPSTSTPGTAAADRVPPARDRALGLALLLTAAVVLPRSDAIARAHGPSYDDAYHLERGYVFLTRSLDADAGGARLPFNDPPLGEGLIALPLVLSDWASGRSPTGFDLFGHPIPPEAILRIVALWKSILFLPLAGVVFVWCRRLYGAGAAWLALAMLLVEPSFAAHLPVAALDVLGVEGIALACFCWWRALGAPTTGRLVAAAASSAAALLLKHTAAILPLVVAAMAWLQWRLRPRWLGTDRVSRRAELPTRARSLGIGLGVALAAMWAMLLFDVRPPVIEPDAATSPALRLPCPGGIYAWSLHCAARHGREGHLAYLNGEKSKAGWWRYFLVAAGYKVPIGLAIVMGLGLVSLAKAPPRWDEWGLALPFLAWSLFLAWARINIGFRHVLPAYLFLLMLSARCLAVPGRGRAVAAWLAVAAAGLHGATCHPDYLAYINAPWPRPYLAISDSNVDWGQALPQLRAWLDARPRDGRRVSLHYFGPSGRRHDFPSVRHYLGDRVAIINLPADADPPRTGLLVLSPASLVGLFDKLDRFAALRAHEPDAVVGHCLLAFDLDRLGGGRPWSWGRTIHRGDAEDSEPGKVLSSALSAAPR